MVQINGLMALMLGSADPWLSACFPTARPTSSAMPTVGDHWAVLGFAN